MGKNKLRDSNICENCGASVEVRYCSTCGQENSVTRQSFHYLFTHFLEDLIHYDNGFWKTFKLLLYKPYELTHTYLEGKRKMYVAPVKLFIFVNFLAFLLLGMLPDVDKDKSLKNDSNIIEQSKQGKGNGISELLLAYNPKLKTKYTGNELDKKFTENVKYYFPKLLFIYLPFFAFTLWLFHSKKKWWYFEHGVYTLHFFSTILLLLTLHGVFTFVFDNLNLTTVSSILSVVTFIYIIYIFYHSHHLMYLQSRFISHVKAFFIVFINLFIMLFLMLCLFWFSFIML